jgi:hypothetical protein
MDVSSTANTSIEAPLYCAEQIKVPEALPVRRRRCARRQFLKSAC